MNQFKKKETPKKPKPPSRFRRALLDFFAGTFLVKDQVLRHAPFVLFLVGLAIAYISYGYHAEHTVKEFYRLESEVKDLKTEEVTLKSDLETIKQESRVAERIQELGLVQSVEQPFKIELSTAE